MSDKVEMVLIGTARYRREDARRLGLLTDDVKVLTVDSKRVTETTAPSGLITTDAQHLGDKSTGAESTGAESTGAESTGDGDQLERPGKSGTKAAWTEFALANGKTEADLDGLKRDDIAALFPESE